MDTQKELTLNEIKCRLSGTCNISAPLKLGETYDITISKCDTVSGGERIINEDGTFNELWKIKISELSELRIISVTQIIKGEKRKGSMSQKLRQEIWNTWNEEHAGDVDFETYYIARMAKLIADEQNK